MKQSLIDRLTSYVQIDTQSDASSETTPSTRGQWDLLHQLKREMEQIGLEQITLDEHGYLFGTLPSNVDYPTPTVGLLAHVDTATDYTGKNVRPQLHEQYDGSDIPLSEDVTMTVRDFPNLKNYVGHTLMTTDGTTLLGADNKAGIAEIMTAMHYLIEHPTIPRPTFRIGFTPDEEIGRGPHRFDVEAFGADFAYTMDGGPIGELQYESFNAASATVTCHGINIHPGTAKDKMVNSLLIAHQFQAMMPAHAVPEKTDGYDGFIYLMQVDGTTEKTTLHYIIRDFDRDAFEQKKEWMRRAVSTLQAEHGSTMITVDIEDQYFNMKEKIEPVMHIVDAIEQLMRTLDIEPIIEPIRGGTDGSQLSYMGLPTPNIFTGGENYHGKYEFISIDNMERAVALIIEMSKHFARPTEL